ncbi:ribosomal subunit 39S-domain-containing protein [Astrocystis sublimbata]|nr:ribosomal subunit 39S-domain-containing protein [Astrocystis sublimbata]
MRRISRLTRPSSLLSTPAVSSSSHSTQLSRTAAAASPFTTTTTTTITQSSRLVRRPTTTAPYPSTASLGRFYSADKNAGPDKQQSLRDLPSEAEARTADQIIASDVEATEVEGAEIDAYSPLLDEPLDTYGPYATPPPRVEAARENEVADPKYIPASTSRGLKTVGGLANWWDRPGNWALDGDFTSFRPRHKVTTPVLVEAAVRRALVEAHALRNAGHEQDLVTVWPSALSKSHLQRLLTSDLKTGQDGTVVLGGDFSPVVEALQWKDAEDSPADNHEVTSSLADDLTVDEVAALAQTWDPSWKTISLADSRLRFAVTKRVFQLTGQLVPDHLLTSVNTVNALLRTLKKPPKPATLTEEIEKRSPELLDMPNVTVAAKRVTRGDKEKALGRLKLMHKEFKKRDIPAYGHGYARKGDEIKKLDPRNT